MSEYSKVPSKAKVKPTPFKVSIPEEQLQDLQTLLKHSKLGVPTYENQQQDRRYGTPRDWLANAKKHWETSFDWREHEKYINSFPHFTLPVKDDEGGGFEYVVHFVALFSEKEDAIPLVFYHGWPGSFLEFLSMLSHIKSQYSAANLPYHIIVPSLPGYTFTNGPPLDRDFSGDDIPRVMNKFMNLLGFGDGYIAQGGDLGSSVARTSALLYPECKAYHLNMNMMTPPPSSLTSSLPVSAAERAAMPRGDAFKFTGMAYALEHGTRTATIGLVLSSSPLALLSWVGEKFVEWSDEAPGVEEVLRSVVLYWVTGTGARGLFPYRRIPEFLAHPEQTAHDNPGYNTGDKPMGFSWFPKELVPIPESWTRLSGNVVFYKSHSSGGHFAAMERPEALWRDVEEFVGVVGWK